MPTASPQHENDAALVELTGLALARLRAQPGCAALLQQEGLVERCSRVAVVSDFAIEVLARQPQLLARLAMDDGAAAGSLEPLMPEHHADWARLLREFRAAESTRLVWRDALGLDDVDAILAESTALAEQCLQAALDALETEFLQRHGEVRAADGTPQRLVVFALGKLGGGELNFSSDIDLVFAYPQQGASDGARALPAEDYFARLGQALARLLGEVTADGFVHRVDLRLRPFGTTGRIALSFAALEQYFQREGRDWERYAWLKARPVAGDVVAGGQWLQTLRPFVYRRYLDYGALAGLREMKASIAAEVARRELADDIKRGPGGIREIEFLVQALQLIRGGREPALRERRLLPALQALAQAGHLPADTADALAVAYRCLRALENRLQMLRDAQTHALPTDRLDRLRLARGLGHGDWPALRALLDGHRERVSREFDALLASRARLPVESDELAAHWQALPESGEPQPLQDAGFREPAAAQAALQNFLRGPAARGLSVAARARLDRIGPELLRAAAAAPDPDGALRNLLALLQALLRRATYLALLDERPAALARVVEVCARSALLAERLASHPLLLDELLDARAAASGPTRADLQAALAAVVETDSDTESALLALNEARQAFAFRIGLATLDAGQDAAASARQLAWLADALLAQVLPLALREVEQAHGRIEDGRFAILGYGSLGGEELGFGSDLDLVFVYRADSGAVSDGARALDAPRWYARLAQKLVALLGAATPAGRLYEADIRLRPDGAKGLLVSTMQRYEEYQRSEAWTWEHQALVRARWIAGDQQLHEDFDAIRRRTLGVARDVEVLRSALVDMRGRMRGEHDRSRAGQFDLKQGEGGLVDLEFLLQYLVLRDAHTRPQLLDARATPDLLATLCRDGALPAETCAGLLVAHAALLDAGLRCTLDRRPRLGEETVAITQARAAIRAALADVGLSFVG